MFRFISIINVQIVRKRVGRSVYTPQLDLVLDMHLYLAMRSATTRQ
jgi:hypothetical protein